MTTITNNGKTLTLSIGLGSGAFHPMSEPDIIYLISDRGPNIPDTQAKDLLGVDLKDQKGKVFPVPTFTPTIYKIKLNETGYQILETLEIKDEHGEKITGLPNPGTEKGFDLQGKIIADDPKGLDTEAIVKLKDGTFYVSDEYLPSLVHIASDGKILKRLTPGKELPLIITKRRINRGIEAIALSPDEKYLYYSMESPLENPNDKVLTHGRLTRMFRLNLKTQTTDQHYLYQLDEAKTFRDDSTEDQRTVKISEMAMIDKNHILILERIEKTSKLYAVNIHSTKYELPSKWSEKITSPTLEELDEEKLKQNEIYLLPKKLVLDSATVSPKLPLKLEGMTYLGNNEWLLINDNDFGITGETTQMIRIKLKEMLAH